MRLENIILKAWNHRFIKTKSDKIIEVENYKNHIFYVWYAILMLLKFWPCFLYIFLFLDVILADRITAEDKACKTINSIH